MAKSNSILNLQGTLGGITHVDSRRYRPHIRKARSTSGVNEVFKQNQQQITDANKPARLIKNVVDEYRQDFKGGMLWQWLVKYFKAQVKEEQLPDVTGLVGMEVHDDHHLKRFLTGRLEWSLEANEEVLHFKINHMDRPDFKRKYPDAYSVSAIAIFPDFEGETADHSMITCEAIPLEEDLKDADYIFPIPAGTEQYLVILKLQAYTQNEICAGHSTKGMRIVAAGRIEEEDEEDKMA